MCMMVQRTRMEKNNMPKALLLSLMSLALAGMATAQNLVPNGSFEEPPSCVGTPWAYTLELAAPWFSPSTSTPDLYTIDSISECGTFLSVDDPNNSELFRVPFDGNRFAGFYAFNDGDTLKDYCSVPLFMQLLAGHTYKLRMRYQAYSAYRYAVGHLGALFTHDPISLDGWGMIHMEPQITFSGDSFLDQADDWGVLEGFMVAQGGEAFLTIGSFVPNDQVVVEEVSGSNYTSAYYLLDGVELEDITVGVVEQSFGPALTCNGEHISWSGNAPLKRIVILDACGRTVQWHDCVPMHGSITIPPWLPTGAYTVNAVAEGRVEHLRFFKD